MVKKIIINNNNNNNEKEKEKEKRKKKLQKEIYRFSIYQFLINT